ncbi:hypothetical protein [Streptomyces sp. NPDC018045]|uniref:hypothetical protein n=1 Tax=Streptomyces sp. NPDC018045 TaxID=3365037 RepID=UPI0037882299
MPTPDRNQVIFYAACVIGQSVSQLDQDPPPAVRNELIACLDWGRAIVEAVCPEAVALLRSSQ